MSYKGVINKIRNNEEQLKYKDFCIKLLNNNIDFIQFMENTPFHYDSLFRFDSNNNYYIDVGHYLFKTIMMLNKNEDIFNIIDKSIIFINNIITRFIKSHSFNKLFHEHKLYTSSDILKYSNSFCNNIQKIHNINYKLHFIIQYIFTINIINHYKPL